MKALSVVWQRLVSSGETCPRCAGTGDAVESAYRRLRTQMLPLGMEPVLEQREVDEDMFRADPSESKRIRIAGRPVEQWLGASMSRSPCCSVCGDSARRTIAVGGNS